METISKPTREPDHRTSYGSEYWFNEGVYMAALGWMSRIKVDEDTGDILCVYHPTYGGEAHFSDDIKEAYRQWLYGSFEKAMLGQDDKP